MDLLRGGLSPEEAASEREILEQENQKLRSELTELRKQKQELEANYASVTGSSIWRLSAPLRRFLDRLKIFLRALRASAASVKTRRKQRQHAAEIDRLAAGQDVTLSILVPLYNTDVSMLRALLRSVRRQTSRRWQLCLADGSDGAHADVEKLCLRYAKKDARVCYKKLEKNLGISGNTNAALALASGSALALLDHDDLLHPDAVSKTLEALVPGHADMAYTDEAVFHRRPSDAYLTHRKPDFSPDTLRSHNYICHFLAFTRGLLEKAGGGFREEYDGSQDYDLILRLSEQAGNIAHIPEVLYYWRAHAGSTAEGQYGSKPYVMASARRALAAHLQRLGLAGTPEDSRVPTTYHIRYALAGEPLVSIVIPNKDECATLRKCVSSILQRSTYSNYEIVIVENNSTTPEIFAYYERLRQLPNVRVVTYEGEFNYSAVNNLGVRHARGEHILLLNNDTEVISPDWLQEMLMFSQRRDVGAVGALLYYPDDTVQHAGVILGLGGFAGHAHVGRLRGEQGYFDRLAVAQNLSAVTAACLMLRRTVWDELQGLDESFAVALNDVDFCLRIRQAGYLIVWTPYAELYHYESKTRGYEDTPEKQARFQSEVERFQARHPDVLTAGDPYYSPAFDRGKGSFEE